MIRNPKKRIIVLFILLIYMFSAMLPTITLAAPFGNAYERPRKSTGGSLPEGITAPKITLPVKAPNFAGNTGGSGNTTNTIVKVETGVMTGGDAGEGATSMSVEEALTDYYDNLAGNGSVNASDVEEKTGAGDSAPVQAQAVPASVIAGTSKFLLNADSILALNDDEEEASEAATPLRQELSNREISEPDLVKLTETYDTAIGLYEQRFDVGRSFLSNIPNGASTNDVAFLDIPKNMSVIAEFDGAYISYADKQRLTETGYYLFTIFCPKITEEGSYRAVFSFRILSPLPIGIDEAGTTKEKPQKPEYFNVSSNNGKTTVEYVFSNHKRFYANVADGEIVEAPVHFLLASNLGYGLQYNGRAISYDNNKPITEPGKYSMRVTAPSYESVGKRAVTLYTDISFTIPEPPEEELQQGTAQGSEQGIPKTITDTLTETVRNGVNLLSFTNGDAFASSIADGGFSDKAVFAIPQSMDYVLYKGNELVSYLSGDEITEPGEYVLSVTTQPDAENVSYIADMGFEIAEPAEPVVPAISEENIESVPEAQAVEGTRTLPSFAEGRNIPEQSWTGKVFNQFIALDTYFTSTIPNGIISGESAQFSIPQNVPRKLYHNGEETEFLGDEALSEHGEYALITTNPLTGGEYLFYFTILPEYGNTALSYVPPLGYCVETITKDGSPYPFEQVSVPISTDGEYVIQLAGGDTSLPKYVVAYNMDTVAPTLEIEGVENGKAIGTEVYLTPNDPDAAITILLDKKESGYSEGTALTKYGDYLVTATDLAGNATEYEFEIPYKMSTTTILFIILILLLIAGGAYYFIRLRKNVKVT